MSYNFLDKTGLAYFWSKIKAKIPTKTSQLTNDSYFNYSVEKPSGTIDDLAVFTSGKPGITGSISLVKKSSGVGSEIPGGWYNFYFSPHRTGSGGDNINYGNIILTPMTFSGKSWILRRASNATTITEVKTISTNEDLGLKTNTSVLPNDNGEIKTKYRIANKSLTGSGSPTWYYPLCKLPKDDNGNYASVIISGRIGGWVSSNMSYINALAWNRSGTGISLLDIAGSGSMSNIWGTCDIVIYTDAETVSETANDNGIDTVYLKCKGYFTFDLDLEMFQSTAEILYNGTYLTTEPTGTLVAQASTSTKRAELYNGKLYVAGSELAKTSSIPTKVSQLTNDSGYTSNTGTVTSVAVKMNNTTKGTVTTSGIIDLGTVITAHQDISGKQDKLTTQTAYTSKGSATKVPQITTNSLGQVTNITEVDIEGGSGLVAYSSIPIGGGCDYYGTVLPDGFMWADGSAISRTTYAELFAVIGTTYGAGDGSTTFNLPDKRERVSVMKKEGGTFDTLGKIGGEEKHKLTNSELSSHGHQVRIWNNAGGGSTSPARTFNSNGDQTTSSLGVQFRNVNVSGVNSSNWVSSGIVAAQGGIGDQAASADKAGGDQAHNNLQPYFVCNYIIRVLNISTTMSATTKDIAAVKSEILTELYPIGSIYMSVNNTSPSTLFGGTWEQIQDRFLLAAGSTYAGGNTGGEATHTLTKAELPNYTLYNASHSHTIFTYRNGAGNGAITNGQQDNYNVKTGTFSQINGTTIKVDSGGSGKAHNNMPPYLVVYMWKRTA